MSVEIVKEGNQLVFVIGGRRIVAKEYLRDNAPYIVLKVLKKQRRRLVFRSTYDMILTLLQYAKISSVFNFVKELLPEDMVPEDLVRVIALFYTYYETERRNHKKPERSLLSLIPREVIDETKNAEEALDGQHEFTISAKELREVLGLEMKEKIKIGKPFAVPTVVGFVTAREAYIYYNGNVYVPSLRDFYVNNMTLGDLITLTQIIKSLGLDKDVDFLTRFAMNAPAIPNNLVDTVASIDYAWRNANTSIAILHYLLGELRGSYMALPVIESGGVSWRNAKVTSVDVTTDSLYLRYRYGKYRGKITLDPTADDPLYTEAVSEILEKNEWLVERARENAVAFMQYMRSYEDYIAMFRSYAKLIL